MLRVANLVIMIMLLSRTGCPFKCNGHKISIPARGNLTLTTTSAHIICTSFLRRKDTHPFWQPQNTLQALRTDVQEGKQYDRIHENTGTRSADPQISSVTTQRPHPTVAATLTKCLIYLLCLSSHQQRNQHWPLGSRATVSPYLSGLLVQDRIE